MRLTIAATSDGTAIADVMYTAGGSSEGNG